MSATGPRQQGFEDLTVLWKPAEPTESPRLLSTGELAMGALITACELLAQRGPAPNAWTTPFRQNPIAFLLDTMNEALILWGPDGTLIYRNRAAEAIGLDCREEVALERFAGIAGRQFERRCLHIEYGGDYVLEIFHVAQPWRRRGKGR